MMERVFIGILSGHHRKIIFEKIWRNIKLGDQSVSWTRTVTMEFLSCSIFVQNRGKLNFTKNVLSRNTSASQTEFKIDQKFPKNSNLFINWYLTKYKALTVISLCRLYESNPLNHSQILSDHQWTPNLIPQDPHDSTIKIKALTKEIIKDH